MAKTYHIPDNFAEGTKILQGMFELRNFLEGCVMAAAVAIIITILPVSWSAKMTLYLVLCIPAMMLGIFGINGDPVSRFVVSLRKWMNGRRTLLYNAHTNSYNMPIGDMLLTTERPVDSVRKTIGNIKQRFSSKNDQENDIIEGIDFEFGEESENSYASRKRVPAYLETTKSSKNKYGDIEFEE